MDVATKITTEKVDEALGSAINKGTGAFTCLEPALRIVRRQLELWDFKHSVYAQESMRDYVEKMEHVHPDKRIPIVPEIGCKILPQLPQTASKEIRDLYITLLSKAANEDTVDEVHPRFIWIVSQCCSEEINILSHIGRTESQSIPYCRYQFRAGVKYLCPDKRFFHPEQAKLAGNKDFNMLVGNLYSLGLFEDFKSEWPEMLESLYPEIDEYARKDCEYINTSLSSQVMSTEPISIKNHYRISEFGKLFLAATDIIKRA